MLKFEFMKFIDYPNTLLKFLVETSSIKPGFIHIENHVMSSTRFDMMNISSMCSNPIETSCWNNSWEI